MKPAILTFALRENADALELDVYETVGDSFWFGGVSARHVRARLKENRNVAQINVRINSRGGDVIDGLAIYQLLKDHPANVTVHVDGLAASIASIIAMAGDEIQISSAGFVMIHNPWAIARGEADDLRDFANVLDSQRNTLASIYAARTGKAKDEILKMMDAETWMDADQAKSLGFVDTVKPLKAKKGAASSKAFAAFGASGFDLFGNVPEAAKRALEQANAERDANPSASEQRELPYQITPGPAEEQPSTSGAKETKTMADKTESNASLVAIVAALGLTSGATESDIQNRVRRLTDMEREAMSLAGVTDSTHTLGALRGMAEKAKAHDELKAELDKVKAERDKQNFETLIAKGKSAPVKLSPATAKLYEDRFAAAVAEGRGADVVADLQGFLAVAPTIIASSSVSPAQAPASSGSNPLLWNGKTYGELKPMERHKLAKENKELFNLMREEHQRQSAA